jgi:hypothetical protein
VEVGHKTWPPNLKTSSHHLSSLHAKDREKRRRGGGEGGTNEIVSPHLPPILYDSFHDDWRWGVYKGGVQGQIENFQIALI